MDEQQVRLAGCFLEVFPELSSEEITEASSMSVQHWDSAAAVTLLTAVEEEFGIVIEDDDLSKFNSFKGFLNYLQQTQSDDVVSMSTACQSPHGRCSNRSCRLQHPACAIER